MTVLGIDTAGVAGSVALVEGEHVLASLYIQASPAPTRPVLRTIDSILNWAGYELTDLTGFVVNIGPGAFTGLRVGLALAQGLALASGKPLVGCSAFDALVALVPEWEGMICPVLEARKGEVYAAFYRRQGQTLQQTVPGMVVKPDALCTLVTERTLFLGSGVRVYGATFKAVLGKQSVCRSTGLEEAGLAVSLARLGHMRLCMDASESLPAPEPLYIRPADARLPRHVVRTTGGL